MNSEKRRKTKSEVLNSNLLNQSNARDSQQNLPNFNPNNFGINDNLKMYDRINEEEVGKDDFLESFSELITKGQKNHLVEALNYNSEENSVLDGNSNNNANNQSIKNILMNSNKSNKAIIKIITSKFHELYLKLVTQIKSLKQENIVLKKKLPIDDIQKMESPGPTEENTEPELESLKFLINEEMECFNGILFDFNVQFNEMQSQEEALRREILKKHNEIEKLNLQIEESKKQKEVFVKELQTIALKLNEYKLSSTPLLTDDTQQFETDNNKEDDDDSDDFQLLMNAENKEYLIRKIIQENKKYKSIVKVMKTEEADFNNYLIQMEAELDNFAKFKNYCLTKVNSVEENLTKCRDKLDGLSEKIINVEFQLEISDDNNS
jgi:hypothetical protein